MQVRFEWDPVKATSNLQKHGISSGVALQVFGDPLLQLTAERVVEGEQRWQALGQVQGAVLLLVVHTVEEEDASGEVIRVISARKADKGERRRYGREVGAV